MFITISSWCPCPLQVSTTLTQCRNNAGPPSPAPANTYSILGSVSCCFQFVQYRLTPTQRLFNVGPASPALTSIHSAQGSTSCALDYNAPCGPTHITPTQCRLNVTLVQPQSMVSQRMYTRRYMQVKISYYYFSLNCHLNGHTGRKMTLKRYFTCRLRRHMSLAA